MLSGLMFLVLLCCGPSIFAQKSSTFRVANDQQLMEAVSNPAVTAFTVEAGNYPSLGRYVTGELKVVKSGAQNGGRAADCTYAIQESSTCFDPVPPETFVSDTARAITFDLNACGCCPPEDAGTWSVTSGPGTVIFESLTDDTTKFSVDQPGVYSLRYTWPAPWNSYAETNYTFFYTYTGTLQADDTCALHTTVHFEYGSEAPDPGVTLEWTLNGVAYAGPAVNPDGDTLDFELSVPSCGEWTLEAVLSPTNCDPVTISVTVNLSGEDPPVISGVGADTTVICPDEPVFSEPTVDDPCDRNATLTYETDSIPGSCPDHYTLIRTWTATNACGNSSTASQTIEHLPNPNPQIMVGPAENLGDTIRAACDEIVIIPFPEIETACGFAEVFYERSDGGSWTDPFSSGTTTVCYWGISPCGYSTDTLCLVVIKESCGEQGGQHCTVTQGYYGNAGGTFCNGQGTADLIDDLLSESDLVVGSGGNTMTFHAGESGCVIALLPGGGPAKTISGDNDCDSHPGIQIKKGRIHNVLLAQTITLGLNLRLDGDLDGLEIFSDTLMTAPSSGCDGEGDTITGPYSQSTIPLSVYNVLSNNGAIIPTVGDLYALANTALGGGAIGATTLKDISDAVSRINEGFDECAFGYFVQPLNFQSMAIQGNSTTGPENSSTELKISPNPFSYSANIQFTASYNSAAVVEIYTITGAKVATLFDGQVEEGSTYQYTFSGDPGMKQVTYICVIRTDRETQIKRMIMMR